MFSRQVFAPVIPSDHWSERRCVCLLVFAVSIAFPQTHPLNPRHHPRNPSPARLLFYKAGVAAGPTMKDQHDQGFFFFHMLT